MDTSTPVDTPSSFLAALFLKAQAHTTGAWVMAREMCDRGFLTVDQVATATGTSRTTVYRHWQRLALLEAQHDPNEDGHLRTDTRTPPGTLTPYEAQEATR